MKYKIIYGGAIPLGCDLFINKCIINNLNAYKFF